MSNLDFSQLHRWDPEPYVPTFNQRDRKGRMVTLNGKPATCRLRPMLPNSARLEDGKLFLPSFFVYVVQPDARVYLAYAGTQYFVDMRGNHVLPHSQFVHAEKTHVVVYSLLVEKGKLQEVADNLCTMLNSHGDAWIPSEGVKRGDLPFFERSINHA